MTVNDPLAVLLAGLERDEQIARAAEEFWEIGFMLHYSEVQWELGEDAFTHLRQQNPSHTLHWMAAIRAIVASHTRDDYYELPDETTGSCEYCSSYCDERGCRNVVAWPCPTLRTLASIYTEPTEES